MIFIRSIFFNVLFYVTFIALMIVGAPTLAMRRGTSVKLVKLWARLSVRMLARVCGTQVEFRNLHLLPRGGSILAVKHQSFLETFALITVLDDFSYILKKELTTIPFFGWYVKATGQIGIDRGKRGAVVGQLQRDVGKKLAEGCQVVIFPEGTRRPVGVPPVYKSGIAGLCAANNVPCTPVALNTGLFWPRRTFLRRPGTVVIEFLPSIQPDLDRTLFMETLQNAIEKASDRLVAEAVMRDPDLDQALAKNKPAPA